MHEVEQLAGLDSPDRSPTSVCTCVAQIFGVRATEVALLKLNGRLLHFLHPSELQTAGAIPLASSSVSARTARTKQAERFNNFAKVKHFSVFELVKLGESEPGEQAIQKLMSAPILAPSGEVMGVIQVSRKSSRPATAGPDFTSDDLRALEKVGRYVGRLMANGIGVAQPSSG